MNLYEKLTDYSNKKYYPMHMPGHKRNEELFRMQNPYSIDITEIEGFDNLHHAQGVLFKGMERCARLYQSLHTNYLVGGSTAGILTGISASTKKGDKILVGRNCHKAVYHAIYLMELEPVYIYPQLEKEFGINGGIFPKEIEALLIKEPDIKLIVITSPTYEGIVSDVKKIGEIAHKYGIPLMVDEAHGAHLGFLSGFPTGSVTLGADIVIHSIHKTLPAFTQSALIHVNGNLVDYEKIKRYLSIYQSSSPSYLLMSGMEQCVSLLESRGKELFGIYKNRLDDFYKYVKKGKNFRVLTDKIVKNGGFYGFDPSKIIISVKNTKMTGNDLYFCLLNQYKIQMEMVSKDYVLGMTSIGDTQEGFIRLREALLEIDAKLSLSQNGSDENEFDETSSYKKSDYINPAEYIMSSHKAYEKEVLTIPLSASTGHVMAEYIYLYPPGIPLLVPGERMSEELLNKILEYQKTGLSLQGLQDLEGNFVRVVASI